MGGAAIATALRTWGTTVVTTANEHAAATERAPVATRDALAAAGLLSAGAGADLEEARAPVILGTTPRRVAILNVATSVPPAGRASRRRGDVAGRPGVNTLRYAAVVTADPTTFAALRQMAKVLSPDGESVTPDAVTLSGTTIKKGATTSVDLVVAPDDLTALLDDIRAARTAADVVVVSLHTHEPENRSESPAPFVRAFAQQAIDAGAALVVGHGSRQLRGVEVHNGGAILYGLGSFAFERSADPGRRWHRVRLGCQCLRSRARRCSASRALHLPRFDEAEWWESVVVTADFDGPRLSSVRLLPVDLGVDLAAAESWAALRLAATGRAPRILDAPAAAVFGVRGHDHHDRWRPRPDSDVRDHAAAASQ